MSKQRQDARKTGNGHPAMSGPSSSKGYRTRGARPAAGYGSFDYGSAPDLVTVAKSWISATRVRAEFLDAGMFSDPAWEILLLLYVAHKEAPAETIVDLSGLGISDAALNRWLAVLEGQELIARHDEHPALSDTGVKRMEEILQRASDSNKALGIGRLRLA